MKQYSTEEQRRRAKINKRKKMLRMPLTIIEHIIYRIKYFYDYKIYYPIRWFFQRGIRGYDDRAHWDMQMWIVRYIPKIIREIKKHIPGAPVGYEYDEWQNVLENIASCFDEIEYEEEEGYVTIGEPYDTDKIKEGLALIIKYLEHLWW